VTAVETYRELADQLHAAERDVRPVPALTDRWPELTVEDAYAIQQLNVERRVAAGARIAGRKVGLTSAPMQQMLGVDQPDYGVLLDDMFVEEGDDVPLERLIAPRVEAEIAFVLGADLAGPGVSSVAALRAIAGAFPALEIIDSRVADWKITLADTVADNASSGMVALGARVTPIEHLDLRLLGMAISRNGVAVDSGAGAAVLGHPARCVAWLANRLATFGASLRAGDVILAGALHRAIPIVHGDVVRAEFAHLGAVTARFADATTDPEGAHA
jgi:2-keto-4-pentenoate hydratase